jgi:hypothetical protein
MAKQQINEAVLLRTSAATDVQSSGGYITIAGLSATWKKLLSSIKQIKYKAEVPQVVTIGGVDTTWVPVGSTVYGVLIGDSRRNISGSESPLKLYSYKTSLSLAVEGTTAQLRREYIATQIVAKINADPSNYGVAAVTSNGTFTFTDDAGYNPLLNNDANLLYAQGQSGRMGKSTVQIWQNNDGTGYATNNIAVTTAAVYAFGVGADLANGKPVMDFMYGNLIQGTLIAPPLTTAGLGAVSGQIYEAFVINSFNTAAAHNQTGQDALIQKLKTVWVDNGTGSATTNLAGFKAIERVFHKLMVQVYSADASCVQEWFDRPIVFQDPLGAAPTGTADTLGWQYGYTPLNRTNIGTQTIVAPVLDATGLLIDQDDTATEGSHTSANQQTLGDQSFVVGKAPFMVAARYVMGDYTDAAFMVGFRKKAVYGAVINNYTDYATIGNGSSAAGTTWINGDLFATRANINGGTTLQAISAVAPSDGVSVLVWLKVALDGSVTAFVNGTSYPIYSVGTTALIFDAGDEMIPFYQIVNIGGGDPACSIGEFFAVADDKLIS